MIKFMIRSWMISNPSEDQRVKEIFSKLRPAAGKVCQGDR